MFITQWMNKRMNEQTTRFSSPGMPGDFNNAKSRSLLQAQMCKATSARLSNKRRQQPLSQYPPVVALQIPCLWNEPPVRVSTDLPTNKVGDEEAEASGERSCRFFHGFDAMRPAPSLVPIPPGSLETHLVALTQTPQHHWKDIEPEMWMLAILPSPFCPPCQV